MMISLILYATPPDELGAATIRGFHWAMVGLSTPAVVILGSPFLFGAAKDLRRKRISMDALIVTGSFAAYSVSVFNVIKGNGHVYFDTATMLLLIVTLGRLMEAKAKSSTSKAIADMISIMPVTARIRRNGKDIEIPADQVRKGDILIVKPGERIPADGKIISGECLVEESAFTGESRPRSCSPGDLVYGGSINCDGLINVQATAVGSASLLAQIQQMVEEAQHNSAPVERLAERVASVFVPIVWIIAAGTAVYWGVFQHNIERGCLSALAVLVVACPCALGIATPLAACLAIGKAAKAGVLIRSGDVLERLPKIHRVFFDKTGTLTTGKLAVGEIVVSPEVTTDEVMSRLISLETASEHAIAKAIMGTVESRGCAVGSVADFRTHPGHGVSGLVTLNGSTKKVSVGSLKFLSPDYEAPPELTQRKNGSRFTSTYIAWDGRIRGAVYMKDQIRPEASKTVRELADLGISVAIISGDREDPVRKTAEAVGIRQFLYECTPVEKVEAVQEMRGKSRLRKKLIAVVGDGINDAPALAEADVGIAIGGGTDLARQASDVTLLGDDLLRIPWVIRLSQATYSIIRQNLLWAFSYNIVAMGLAVMGHIHPLIAATAMVASSLAVITNSMRILRLPNLSED